MAIMYQNVGTPRFFVNVIEWLDLYGLVLDNGSKEISSVFKTLPVDMMHPTGDNVLSFPLINNNYTPNVFSDKSFIACLGHKDVPKFKFPWWCYADSNIRINLTPENTSETFGGELVHTTDFDGFSIASFNYLDNPAVSEGLDFGQSGDIPTLPTISFTLNETSGVVGSYVFGTYYDMPVSPNLSLVLSREYGGTKEITAKNGSTYSNTMWHGVPKWGDLGAWELRAKGELNYSGTYATDQALSKSGRRAWNLTFSYMDDRDVWGVHQGLGQETGTTNSNLLNNGYLDSETEGGGLFYPEFTLLEHDNFYSQVWHKTAGGTIPFLFQPNNNNPSPDSFAICRIRSNSLKVTQSAFNVYDVSLVIEEVW
tara:strand:- start:797 stop:1900 length:1104 start_codon:yes stop_codon:yes gene_type:complete